MGEQVTVRELPLCDICIHEGAEEPKRAAVDGALKQGSWAYMCDAHFVLHGVGVGTGKGQRLVLPSELKKQEPVRGEELEIKLAACAELGLEEDEAMVFLEDMGEL